MAKCKNKGPCICGKKEQYLFTPHLSNQEIEEMSEEDKLLGEEVIEVEPWGAIIMNRYLQPEYTVSIEFEKGGEIVSTVHEDSDDIDDYEDFDLDFYVPIKPKAIYRIKVSKVTKIL